jgi:TetR/AcrR family transcriptional regulator
MAEQPTREKILNAADDLFAELGYDAATTREIAARSGVNKALIHYHFESKEGLLSSILDRYYQRLTVVLQEAAQSGEGILDRMNNISDAYMDFLAENRNFARTVQREASGGRYIDRVRVHMVPIFELGVGLIQGEYPSTESGPMSAGQLLTTFYGMVVTYFTYSDVLEFLLGKDPLSGEALEMRKKHLHRMLEVVVGALEEQERASGRARRQRAGAGAAKG